MQTIARFSIERPLYPWLLAVVCMVGGWYGIENVGRLEDPAFPIKMVLVVTEYPGASAREVEQEVTDVIEAALQQLPYIEKITSKSLTGRSEVTVELQEQWGVEETPQIFDELRRRVREAERALPPGSGVPLVEDDFGDVFGVLYAVAAAGYSDAEQRDVARRIVTTLEGVEGVAKVVATGLQQEAIFVEIDHARLVRLGLPIEQLFASIGTENRVVPAGTLTIADRRLRIAPEIGFDSVDAVANMRIGRPGSTEILRLGDIARVVREQVEVPTHRIRHDGEDVFVIGVSVVPGLNVVKVGAAVDAALADVTDLLPLGVTVTPIYAQHAVVDEAVRTFLTNLLLSVGTVVLALCVFMGWRAGTVVGVVLLLTVAGTLLVMSFAGIELQRISLGALMIAMGMLVDNGIVVAEGMLVGVRLGMAPADAAERAVERTKFPLLGATVIGVMAFAPISLSDDNSGHFLVSLFQVVAIALLLSWLLAVTLVPLLGSYVLRVGKAVDESALYDGVMYAPYRGLLWFGLRRPWLTTAVIVAITGACIWAFQFVKPGFFPSTNTPLFYVHAWHPEGTDIHATIASAHDVEQALAEMDGVNSVTSFIGRGPPRFMTIINPEQPNPAYAQYVVRVEDVSEMNAAMQIAKNRIETAVPGAHVRVTRSEFTPGGSWKIEARFSGPNPEVLRRLAERALDVYLEHDLVDRTTDWRQPALALVPQFDDVGARSAGITREQLSQALAFATEGVQVGLYRERDKLLPIVARAPRDERSDAQALTGRLVWSPSQQQHIPMSQIVSGFELVPENATIYRRNRMPTISALANAQLGFNPTRTLERISGDVEALELPAGYRFEWGGEFEANQEANDSLTVHIPTALGIMFLITVLMFGQLRQPIVIWLTVPMIVCGVVVGLVATNLSFTFPSFLGFLSLVGMLIKNCIVLVDEIDKRLMEQGASLRVMLIASVSRLRPVMLAAGTTIAGMAPLLADAFFREMAVCIMSGLAFATLLTLVAVPVFYRIALGRTVSVAHDTRTPAVGQV